MLFHFFLNGSSFSVYVVKLLLCSEDSWVSNKQGMKLLLLLAAALHPQNTSKLLLWPFKSQRRTGQMFFFSSYGPFCPRVGGWEFLCISYTLLRVNKPKKASLSLMLLCPMHFRSFINFSSFLFKLLSSRLFLLLLVRAMNSMFRQDLSLYFWWYFEPPPVIFDYWSSLHSREDPHCFRRCCSSSNIGSVDLRCIVLQLHILMILDDSDVEHATNQTLELINVHWKRRQQSLIFQFLTFDLPRVSSWSLSKNAHTNQVRWDISSGAEIFFWVRCGVGNSLWCLFIPNRCMISQKKTHKRQTTSDSLKANVAKYHRTLLHILRTWMMSSTFFFSFFLLYRT